MRTKKLSLSLAVVMTGAMMLSSCSKDEDVNIDNGAVCFTAAIGNQAVAAGGKTRASGKDWSANDKIGIFMVNHDATTIAEGAANKRYTTTDGTGTFTPIIGSEIYYPMDNSAVDFIAYYPYEENMATLDAKISYRIGTPQTSASQAGFDLLWAKADNAGNGYNKTNGKTVALSFRHCLSKLTMNCKIDPSVGASTLDDNRVTIKGMNSHVNVNLATGTLDTPDAPMNIIARDLPSAPDGFVAAYDAIIMPSSYADGVVTVEFIVNNETFVWNVGQMEFKGGHEYIYEVVITRSGVQAQGTIVPWNSVNKGSVIAE